MSDFVYFAYGSNMLIARLRERCPSARPLGLALAPAYRVAFNKLGMDGSGKATLTALAPYRQEHPPAPPAFGWTGARGVLYRIDMGERAALDRAEGNYRRDDAFAVLCAQSGKPITSCTYIAETQACRDDLVPLDWYVALMRAGATEHGHGADYIAWLSAIETCNDPDLRRAARMAALAQPHR
jgi:hypothetical protein